MALVLEPPDETKPYASFERNHVSIDCADVNFGADTENNEKYDMICDCIEKALQSPILPKNELSREEIDRLEKQRQKQREETLKCETQRIDQLLRKLVGAVGRVEKKRSREANEARKSIMEKVRKHDGTIDRSEDSIVQHFAKLMTGTEMGKDWYDVDDPIIQSMKATFQEFQKEGQAFEPHPITEG
eukprot:CAMPEP_0183760670 /NCGR_PEP_ID=MMETSP0739-20130205/7906_1 /TAXON_ID=385413 /ORGANISM="Thalassiosira miniscula, Strain CCMP1093" /LENGTH=186 /DNA_ID=CAMNT_0025998677 /DNA_START=114 /DNA_END=675 /DNA_ORIENTATION=+